jgi:hypothetical protein
MELLAQYFSVTEPEPVERQLFAGAGAAQKCPAPQHCFILKILKKIVYRYPVFIFTVRYRYRIEIQSVFSTEYSIQIFNIYIQSLRPVLRTRQDIRTLGGFKRSFPSQARRCLVS